MFQLIVVGILVVWRLQLQQSATDVTEDVTDNVTDGSKHLLKNTQDVKTETVGAIDSIYSIDSPDSNNRESTIETVACGCWILLLELTMLTMLIVVNILLFVNVIPSCVDSDSESGNGLRLFGIAHFCLTTAWMCVSCCSCFCSCRK
jgi:hypothetical protein